MPLASAAARKLPALTPDVDVEVVEVDALERLLEGQQRADLVDRAERAAAREGEADRFAPHPSLRRGAGARAVQAVDARLQLGDLARQRAHVLGGGHAELRDRPGDALLEHLLEVVHGLDGLRRGPLRRRRWPRAWRRWRARSRPCATRPGGPRPASRCWSKVLRAVCFASAKAVAGVRLESCTLRTVRVLRVLRAMSGSFRDSGEYGSQLTDGL